MRERMRHFERAGQLMALSYETGVPIEALGEIFLTQYEPNHQNGEDWELFARDALAGAFSAREDAD